VRNFVFCCVISSWLLFVLSHGYIDMVKDGYSALKGVSTFAHGHEWWWWKWVRMWCRESRHIWHWKGVLPNYVFNKDEHCFINSQFRRFFKFLLCLMPLHMNCLWHFLCLHCYLEWNYVLFQHLCWQLQGIWLQWNYCCNVQWSHNWC